MKFLDYLEKHIVFLDGAVGSILQSKSQLASNEYVEDLYFTNPALLDDIHQGYYDAGCNVVSTCTFRVNAINFPSERVEPIIQKAFESVSRARANCMGEQKMFIALETGPLGKLLKPLGDIEFEEAVQLFSQVIRAACACGVDLISIQTMNDSLETKAAVLAVKENCDLPIVVSNTYGSNNKLMNGASPSAMINMLEGLGADVIGINCALGPAQMTPVVDELLSCASVPVFIKPNAGIPKTVDGRPVYEIGPEEYAEEVVAQIEKGVHVAAGCCGTSPEYLERLISRAQGTIPKQVSDKKLCRVSSYCQVLDLKNKTVSTGKTIDLDENLSLITKSDQDFSSIISSAIGQENDGAELITLKCDTGGLKEATYIKAMIEELQAIITVPLCVNTKSSVVTEAVLRIYNGKALVDARRCSGEELEAICPIAKKYGAVIVVPDSNPSNINTAEQTKQDKPANYNSYAKIPATCGISDNNVLFESELHLEELNVGKVSETLNNLGTPLVQKNLVKGAIIRGHKYEAQSYTSGMLSQEVAAEEIIDGEIMPALSEVGKNYETGKFFLAQLYASAEAAKSAFAVIKETIASETLGYKGDIVLATVAGDMHDIGKNIVRLLLENNGYKVHDLGVDVEATRIAERAKTSRASLIGLSALMTTSIPSMKATIAHLHKELPWCKIMVGGAVLSSDLANEIRADYYAQDATDAVRIANSYFANRNDISKANEQAQ